MKKEEINILKKSPKNKPTKEDIISEALKSNTQDNYIPDTNTSQIHNQVHNTQYIEDLKQQICTLNDSILLLCKSIDSLKGKITDLFILSDSDTFD